MVSSLVMVSPILDPQGLSQVGHASVLVVELATLVEFLHIHTHTDTHMYTQGQDRHTNVGTHTHRHTHTYTS